MNVQLSTIRSVASALGFGLLLLAGSRPAIADEVVVAPEPSAETARLARPGDRPMPRGVTPLVAELLRLVDLERQTLNELRAAMAQTSDPAQQLDLQRQVEAVKRDTQRALLRTQIEFARREGRAQVASELESALLRLDGVVTPPSGASIPVAPATQTP